ncbi:MAG: hypothetical protein B6D41_17925 [Chloroflexi bacterium UTCFX4]|nr:MAG: hypothetical protein B6D41_17925 [Chloroflexi bacterium UTCFX4]
MMLLFFSLSSWLFLGLSRRLRKGFSILHDGVSADDEIADAVGVEKIQQSVQVGVDEHHSPLLCRRVQSIPM